MQAIGKTNRDDNETSPKQSSSSSSSETSKQSFLLMRRFAQVVFLALLLTMQTCHQVKAFLSKSPNNALFAAHKTTAPLLASARLGGSKRNNATTRRPHTARRSSLPTSFSSQTSIGGRESDRVVLDPLVVCGPSGVGKGTIIQRFMTDKPNHPLQFGFSVSHTTRAPREGEVDGVHYHFTSKEEMQSLISGKNNSQTSKGGDDFFMEWAQVHGNYYGTSWGALMRVQESGQKCLLDIDVQGVRRLKELQQKQQQQKETNTSFVFAPKYIFIAPPSLQTLQDRLRQRATETPESLNTRLSNAAAEVTYGNTPGNFDAIVVNDNLEDAISEFRRVVENIYS